MTVETLHRETTAPATARVHAVGGSDSCLVDPLTGLWTADHLRTRMERLLEMAAEGGESLAVLLFDIAGLETINAQYGRETGDRVLVHVAQQLGRACGPLDHLFRFGEDEFVVLAEGADRAEAEAFAAGLERLHLLDSADDDSLEVRLRTGIALYPGDGGGATSLLGHAVQLARGGRRAAPDAPAEAPAAPPSSATAPPVVLIVDGDPGVRSSMARILSENLSARECSIVTAAGPREAWRRLRRAGGEAGPAAVFCIIAEMELEDASGVDFLRRMRTMYPHAARVLMTSRPDLSTALEALEDGTVTRFVTKPWHEEKLQNAIERLLDARRVHFSPLT
jgi:diguanylate cyclase (GGDEF)-like protein